MQTIDTPMAINSDSFQDLTVDIPNCYLVWANTNALAQGNSYKFMYVYRMYDPKADTNSLPMI